MSTSLIVIEPPTLPATLLLQAEHASAHGYMLAEKAPASQAAYRADMRIFSAWCDARGLSALPASPDSVAAFLASEADAGRKTATVARRCAAIRHCHRLAGCEPPTNSETVKTCMRGIRRTIGAAHRQMAPITADRLASMFDTIPKTLAGLRDKALLAIGFSAALRRSELVRLTVGDVTDAEGGICIRISRSKTDQSGEGVTLAVPHGTRLQPVLALRNWLTAAAIVEGPLFRAVRGNHVAAAGLSDRTVNAVVAKYIALAGMDPAPYGAHSLRSGYLTEAAMRGASVFKLMEQSRHRSVHSLAGYIRAVDRWRDHSGAEFL